MVLERYMQSATERIRYGINYAFMLDEGETISNPVFSVNKSTSPPLVCDDPQIITGNALIWYVSGGVAGQQYYIKVQVETSLGQIREDEVIFTIEC